MTVTIRDLDGGWVMHAYNGTEKIGSAVRVCVGGSRGKSWYWDLWVAGKQYDAELPKKAGARAELIRLCEQHLAVTA